MLSAWRSEGGVVVQSWDTAVKAGAEHDASACATFIERAGTHYLLDVWCARQEYPELKRSIIGHAARYTPDFVLIEDKASGQSLLQDLRRETALPVIACMPTVDKHTRVVRVTPMMEAGRVALPKQAPWLADFETELFAFPDGAHDDRVDAVSQYLNWMRDRATGGERTIRRV